MTRNLTFIFLLTISSFNVIEAASPVAYNTILVIVILELIIALIIAVVCILFSLNLLRALKDSSPDILHSMSSGDLPPSKHQQRLQQQGIFNESLSYQYNPLIIRDSNLDLSQFHDTLMEPHRISVDSEFDIERPLAHAVATSGIATPAFISPRPSSPTIRDSLTSQQQETALMGLVKTFGGYIRLW
jgi:hypothetical protein